MKIPKKRNKIKGLSITCSYIWHTNTSKCVYWLDIHSDNVWLRHCRCVTDDYDGQNSYKLMLIYGPFGPRTFLSVCRKKIKKNKKNHKNPCPTLKEPARGYLMSRNQGAIKHHL